MSVCIYIPGHIVLPVLSSSAPFSVFPLCSLAPPNQYTASGVLTSPQDHCCTLTQRIVRIKQAGPWRGSQQMDTHTHTHIHKDRDNEVPPEFPHNKHHTNSPWRLGKEKLSVCHSSLSVQFISFIGLLSLSITPSSFPPWLCPLCWLVCVCVDVLWRLLY